MFRVSVFYWWRGFVVLFLLMSGLLAAPLAPVRAAPAAACGDIVINEIKFKQTSGTSGVSSDEWVELYVVNTVNGPATITVDDLELGPILGKFSVTLSLASGSSLAAGSYVIMHDNTSGSSEAPPVGTAVNISAQAYSTSRDAIVTLDNTGDNVLLTIDGTACEEVHWGTRGADANIAPATAAAITIAFGSASSVAAGESIQRSPNGSGSTFLRAGTGVPGATAVGSPTTMGHSNNVGPNAITLSSFAAAQQTPGFVLVPVLGLASLLAAAALARRRFATI